MPITANRGRMVESLEGVPVLVTIHPSYLLRLPDADLAERERMQFVDDLQAARRRLSR
jgi:uracil-DNA glycosylase